MSFAVLNRDDVRQVKVTTSFTLDLLWVPQTILAADLVVSMPKVKTHHWAGVTLSLKNMFGTIPGSVYGWPKNVLHWKVQRANACRGPLRLRSCSHDVPISSPAGSRRFGISASSIQQGDAAC